MEFVETQEECALGLMVATGDMVSELRKFIVLPKIKFNVDICVKGRASPTQKRVHCVGQYEIPS
jgi:hypothetical protein